MLNPIYNFVARAVVEIHSVLKHIVGNNGWAWALSIVLLVMAVRLLLFPLFVKQIKSQRQMQIMQPKVKELREKYKNDKQKMNEEMIKLQREHGNPLLGCLPMFLQIPLFLAIFRVMNGFAPKTGALTDAQSCRNLDPTVALHQASCAVKTADGDFYYPTHLNGLTPHEAYQIAHAKIFGASLSSSFRASDRALHLMDSSKTASMILCAILTLIMMVTIYITQRQIIGRNGPATDPQAALTQKVLLYASPFFLGLSGFGVLGFEFSVGVLLYWFTTNLWSMGQQYFVIRRMPPVIPPGTSGVAAAAGAPPSPAPAERRSLLRRPAASQPAPAPAPQRLVQQRPTAPTRPGGSSGSGTGNRQQRRKKGRPGGRH